MFTAFLVILFILISSVIFKVFDKSENIALSITYETMKKERVSGTGETSIEKLIASELNKEKYPFPFFKFLAITDKNIRYYIRRVTPTVDSFHKELRFLSNTEAVKALYMASVNICEKQFYEERNLVSKDQVKEVLADMNLYYLKKIEIEKTIGDDGKC